jgi:hypothetical protein
MTVYFDTFLDRQRAYSFDVNAYGVQGDGVINAARTGGDGGGIPFPDRSWDTLFFTAARVVEDGYRAEMAIPFKSLRYPRRDEHTPHRWGFQIVREIKSKDDENDVWAPMSRRVSSFMEQMGILEGMTTLSTSRNLEFLPTFTAINFGSLNRTTGQYVDQGTSPEDGLNVKYGITSNLISDFTLNPDFSQIESDRPPIDVNQRFPLFFPELRPFFVEGQEIFNLSSPINLVHTRTIVDPRYGAKLTGKAGQTTVGLIVADDEAPGKRGDPADPAFGETAQFVIGRVRYDLYSESHIGALVTDREFMDAYSRVAGLDGQFRLGRATRVNFIAFQSYTRDEQGVERSGPAWGTFFQHNGRSLRFNSFVGSTDPDFRTDAGFVRRVDTQRTFNNLSYRWWPQHWIINWGPQFFYERSYNFAGELEDEIVTAGLNVDFTRSIGAGGEASRSLERFGGIDFWKWSRFARINVNTSRRFAVGGRFSQGRSDLLQPRQPVSGPRNQRRRERHPAAGLAAPVADRPRHWPADRPEKRERRSLRRENPPRVHDVSVHRPAAPAQHHRVQHVQQGRGSEPARHIPNQRRHGVLHRLRRPPSPGRPDQRNRVPDEGLPENEPGDLYQAAVPLPLLTAGII